MNNLIGSDIQLMRDRYDEALHLQGLPCKYQFPNIAESNTQGEPLIDSYSEPEDIWIFLDENPKVSTFKRFGWVVENNENLPFLVHCSWNLPNVQKDSIFRICGQYANIPDRIFRTTEVRYDLQCPDHLVCAIVPCYEDQIVGRTPIEIKNTFNKSNHFLKQDIDYRGHYHVTKQDTRGK